MITIYHNPRCSKSRSAVEYLENKSVNFENYLYLRNKLNAQEIKDLLSKLEIEPIELVRTNEKIWKENFKSQNLTNDQIIEAMVEFPILIERPIVATKQKAVIARPTENIDKLL